MKICIATGRAGFLRKDYLIAKLAWHWERAGVSVETSESIPRGADLAILHVDRTRVDAAEVPGNPEGIPLLNGRVLDISKRRFSSLGLDAGTDWAGPVIIKSDLNHFGIPESGGGLRLRQRLAERSWRLARALPRRRYPVVESARAVPGWVWSDPDLLVEKFLPERSGDLFCLRGWVFFGPRSYAFRLFSTDPMVKTGSMVRHEFLPGPPRELEEFRARHGFDFGKFDYVEHDGRPILLDANKTPTIVTEPDTPRLRDLAGGLFEILRR
jgi:hypothetical protein